MNSGSNDPISAQRNQIKESLSSSEGKALNPIRSFVILVASIFLIELLIMVFFLFAPKMPDIIESLLDATSLTVLVAPILYRFAIRPLYDYISKQRKLTDELESLNNTLEQRVAERTFVMEKRAGQLRAVSNLARAIASIQDLDLLLPDITRLVSEQFSYYHTGIFLIDNTREFAVLRAANSDGGANMLKRHHKLKLDANSIVGFAASQNEPRIALDVGADSGYFNNPDLPATRSELALPLNVGGNVIGVLDVQSTQPNAFIESDISTLATLADQVAIAIENARLYGEANKLLNESEETIKKYMRQEWRTFTNQIRNTGYLFDGTRTTPLDIKDKSEKVKALAKTGQLSLEKETAELTIPIKFRGQTIGILDVKSKQGSRRWTQDEITLLESAAERAAFALENARLVESAQRRAARERAIGEISAKIGSVSELDTIMQTAVEELGRRIGGATEVILEIEQSEQIGE